MDEGGNLPQLLGLNNASMYEHGFQPLVQFVRDTYTPNEEFKGTVDSLRSIAYGLLSVSVPIDESEVIQRGGGIVNAWV